MKKISKKLPPMLARTNLTVDCPICHWKGSARAEYYDCTILGDLFFECQRCDAKFNFSGTFRVHSCRSLRWEALQKMKSEWNEIMRFHQLLFYRRSDIILGLEDVKIFADL